MAMKFDVFQARNGDLMLGEPSWEEIREIANGAALFYVVLSNSAKPKPQRAVRYAGHVLTAGMTDDGGLVLLRLTARGNTQLDVVYPANVAPNGNAALYRTRPTPADDYRNRIPWDQWDRI